MAHPCERNIKTAFEKAGLHVKFIKQRNKFVDENIFGCWLDRATKGKTRTEVYVMQLGHDDNKINVVNVDQKKHQVLLSVKEEARTFRTKEYNPRTHKKEWVEHKTPNTMRKFLMGVDERECFMCQVNRSARTVEHARSLLKTPQVTFCEGKAKGRTIRQGEFFLVNVTPEEENEIKKQIKKVGVKQNAALNDFILGEGSRLIGKPHVAKELVAMPGRALEHGFTVRRRPEVFIRGSLRHPDHKTVKMKLWRRVILNNEETRESGTFID